MRKAFLKYFILAALTVCAAALLASCNLMYVTDENNPSVAFETFSGYISDGDYRAAFELTGNTVDISSSDLGDSSEEIMLSKIIRSVSMKPLSEPEIKGTSAWQPVSITHLDLRLAVKKLLSGVMDETSAYEWNHGSYKTEEEISQAVYASLCSQLDGDLSDCMITDRVRLQFRYKNGKWTPVMTKPLYNALTGYASETAESIDEFFAEYSAKQSQKTESD
jgi:hypothetical protein